MADTSAVSGAAKSLASALIKEADYLYGVEDRVRSLQRSLECMQEFLQSVDANPNLLKQDGQLRILSCEMRKLAFRAEDAIDTYLVDVRSKVYKKNFLLKLACLASHSYPMHVLRNEIEAILREAEDAKQRCEDYRRVIMPNTLQQVGSNIGSSSSRPMAENYLHLDDEFVVGIDDDITGLVKRLVDPKDDFTVLGIVGTGGAGKTTLASKIYKHSKVQTSFSHRAFVSVSQQWSKLDLLHRISKEITGQSSSSSIERELVSGIHDFMKDKQCLVVLDDIWKKEAWDDIKPIFPRTKGLRVILTIRNEEVPLYADNKGVLHEPKLLTSEDMWALFSKGAMEGRSAIENNAEFEKLAKLMLQKCKGLPLAVVTLAGILRAKQHLYEWERINIAYTNNILKEKGGSSYGIVEDMLELSYLELPTHLKPLFLYLAIIPEDEEFSAQDLTRMWIAEGFITNDQQMGCDTLEDAAMWFLDELAQRFIFQVTRRDYRNHIQFIRLHDLMREFCMKKAYEYQFLGNDTSDNTSTCSSNSRRISICSRGYCLDENHYIRTIVYNDTISSWSSYETVKMLESIHKQFRLLRVLSITNSINNSLPKDIGNLIHLTYLLLDNTEIKKLPVSIRNLRNLIYFVYCPTNGEAELPDNLVENMKDLRVLKFTGSLKHGSSKCNNTLGLSSECHKKLHTLRCGGDAWMKKDLPTLDLPTLRHLHLDSIKEAEGMEAIYGCLSFLKLNLHTFECYSQSGFDVEKVRDYHSLGKLTLVAELLVNNHSIQFPCNLVSLTLYASKIREEVDLMAVLGQLSKLKYLILGHGAYLGTQLSCRIASFPQLHELTLFYLHNLEEWRVEGGAMDRLNKLQINGCDKMKRLPERISSITTLKELTISHMPIEFCRRLGYKRDEDGESTTTIGLGEDSYIIQHIPSVNLFDVVGRRMLFIYS